MTIDVRRAVDRFRTTTGWLDSAHCFSFGPHYDPANTHHGLLVVSNDDVVKAGTGFQTHPHRDMEIVTWVLSGELEHRDTLGNAGVIYPGLVQRMSAGTGIRHSERNARDDRAVRFVQMWVRPDTPGAEPSYEQRDVAAELARGGLHVVASGRGDDAAVSIGQRDAVLHAGRLMPGESVAVPDDRHVHVYVARGAATLEGAGELVRGDSARLTVAGSRRLVAGLAGAEVLVWATA
ncbi:MAG TPA: pirin family protein [Frankiaceae bacterium]|nr:pirin family protein [Frankiaceae bacterium]